MPKTKSLVKTTNQEKIKDKKSPGNGTGSLTHSALIIPKYLSKSTCGKTSFTVDSLPLFNTDSASPTIARLFRPIQIQPDKHNLGQTSVFSFERQPTNLPSYIQFDRHILG
jgi:hypothetical protein